MKSFFFFATLLLAGCVSPHLAQTNPCANSERLPDSVAPVRCEGALRKPELVYAKGFEGKEGQHIQFGFESEYVAEDAGALLSMYLPDTWITGVSKGSWLNLSLEKKVAVIEKNYQLLFPYRQAGKMELITTDPELRAILPPSLVYDGGKFEIVLPPKDFLEEQLKDIKILEEKLGAGSMQLTLSFPLPSKESTTKAKAGFYRAQLGHLNFMNELDTLTKLQTGYERYQKDPQYPAAQSFGHYWLGPMTKVKQTMVKQWISQAAEGEIPEGRRIEEFSWDVTSSKFIGGVSFRPDIARKSHRLAFEIRQCHKSRACIENIVRREVLALEQGLEVYSDYSKHEAFDSEALFDAEPAKVKRMLKALYPNEIFPDQNIIETDIYRNFVYPLKGWDIPIAKDPSLRAKVTNAQKHYRLELNRIANEWESKKLSAPEASLQVMGLISEFPSRSGLLDFFNREFETLNHVH